MLLIPYTQQSRRLQIETPLDPGQCIRVDKILQREISRGALQYQLPIMGHVSVWFMEPIAVRGQQGVKENWQIPVDTLIEVAKVQPLSNLTLRLFTKQ